MGDMADDYARQQLSESLPHSEWNPRGYKKKEGFMSTTYTIKSLKKGNTWESSFGEMQSYALVLEGVGEPVQLNKKMPVKSEPQVGDELTGTLEEQERNGRIFYKFKADMSQKPPGGFKGQPKDEKAIQAQWAIGQAVQCYLAGDTESSMNYENIEKEAIHFYKMINRVKSSTN